MSNLLLPASFGKQSYEDFFVAFIYSFEYIFTMKTHFEEIFAARGWVISEVSRKFNIPHMTLRQHLKGTRSISAEQALKYERLLGIPRSELRPDLWPPEEGQPPVGPTMPHHQASTPEPHEIPR